MMQLVDTAPTIDVKQASYLRLLGYPHQAEPSERAVELTEWARAWYAEHGRPWVCGRFIPGVQVDRDGIRIEGRPFQVARLSKLLGDAGAHAAMVVAVSAGPELEAEAQRLWREEKPDEYFFLEVFGSAVVEHLMTSANLRFAAWARENDLALMPRYSPGYSGWNMGEQARLVDLIRADLPGPLEVLDSGMLRPKKSQLAVIGAAHRILQAS